MIKNLVRETDQWKCVDNTTVVRNSQKGDVSNVQFYAGKLVLWYRNKSPVKYSQMHGTAYLVYKEPSFTPVSINGEKLEIVDSAK